MEPPPLAHEPKRPRRQGAGDQLGICNANQCSVLCIDGVKVRNVFVVKLHLNVDAVKVANRGHVGSSNGLPSF